MLGGLRSVPVWLALATLGCGSSSDAGGTGGAPGSGGSGGSSAGAGGAIVDAAPDVLTGRGPYPTGPYGNQQGDVLADLELEGYLRHDTTGFAYQGSFAPVRLSDVRATAPTTHAVIHVSGFT